MPKKPFHVRKSQSSHAQDAEFAPRRGKMHRTNNKGIRIAKPNSFSKTPQKQKFLERLIDEDTDMKDDTGLNNHGRNGRNVSSKGRAKYSKVGKVSGRPNSNETLNSRTLKQHLQSNSGDSSWHKITVFQGSKYGREFIIGQLKKFITPDSFVPIACQLVKNKVIFYVDNGDHARKIFLGNNKILLPDGQKLLVRTKSEYPQISISNVLKDKLKVALDKRYSSENNALDLTRFHHDPDLREHFCALFKPAIMTALLDIVAKCIPNLSALCLNSNRLESLERLSILKHKLKNLKILHLSDNKLNTFKQFDHLKGIQLEELNIENNPLTMGFKGRKVDCVSEVWKRFPKLLRLNNEELPKLTSFDVDCHDFKFLETQVIFSTNEEAKNVATQFLSEYFRVFDSGDRQNLLNAYHKEACFSLSVPNYLNKNSNYGSENRNLRRVTDTKERRKLLKTNRLAVVSCLTQLPPTQHLLHTLTMDVCLVTDKMMLVVTTGVFKELDSRNRHKFFNRTFTIVPEGSGYCICNEQMYVCKPTEMQEEALKTENVVVPTGEVSDISMATTSEENTQKEQMVLAFSQATNMNLQWSVRCLEECQWIYQNALIVFQNCQGNGQIPLEAFNK